MYVVTEKWVIFFMLIVRLSGAFQSAGAEEGAVSASNTVYAFSSPAKSELSADNLNV